MSDAAIHAALVAAHEVIRDEWIVALQSYCDTDAGGCPDLSTMDEEARPYVARLGTVMEQCRVAIRSIEDNTGMTYVDRAAETREKIQFRFRSVAQPNEGEVWK